MNMRIVVNSCIWYLPISLIVSLQIKTIDPALYLLIPFLVVLKLLQNFIICMIDGDGKLTKLEKSWKIDFIGDEEKDSNQFVF